MKRSGQHGVVNWLAQQNSHNVLHLNNCIQGWGQKKFLPMKKHMVVSYQFNGIEHDIKNFFCDHKIDLEKSRQLAQEFDKTDFSSTEHYIYNIEDLSLAEFKKHQMWTFDGMQENGKTILILRDPFNFISSCLERYKNPPDSGATDVAINLPKRLQMWKEQARQVLNPDINFPEIYFLNFNKWFADKEYRKQICVDLGLTFTDRGVNDVMNFGSGNSFDREKFHGSAQQMSVLNRWKAWVNTKPFNALIDDELIELSEKLFGFNPLKQKEKYGKNRHDV